MLVMPALTVTALISFACLAVHVLTEEVPRSSKLRICADTVSVSYHGLCREGKWWLLITATFGHLGRAHVVNNVLMLWVIAPPLEHDLGSVIFLGTFVLCGAAGWLCSQTFTRCAGHKLWSAGVAQFTTSNGSSPATYGLAMLAAIRDAAITHLKSNSDTTVDDVALKNGVGTAFGLPSWFWFFCVFLIPKFFSSRWGMHVFSGKIPTLRSVALACFSIAVCTLAGPAMIGNSATGTTFFLAYLFRNVLDEFIGYIFFDRQMFGPGCDNASHLGGTICGVVFAWIFYATGPTKWGFGIWVCLGYLILRVVHDWNRRQNLLATTSGALLIATMSSLICTPFLFGDIELRTLAALTIFYTFILLAPSTPLEPTRSIIVASLLFTVVLPILGAAMVIIFHSPLEQSNEAPMLNSTLAYPPAWIAGVHGTGANHNFCEEDHAFSSWIAEFHNSWSSLPIIFYGGVGPYYTRRYATKEMRFSAGFVSIGAVGVGSTLYHATLLRVGQVMDEVPMLCIIFSGIYCFAEDKAERKYGTWLPILLLAMCLGLVAGYLVFYWYLLFLLAFGSGCIGLLVRGFIVVKYASKLSSRILCGAAAAVAFGFACWLLDEKLCNYVIQFRLHIFWHLGTGLGGYLFTMFLLTIRAPALGKVATLIVAGHDGRGWRLSENLVWTENEHAPEFLLPYVEFRNKDSS